MKKQAEIEVKSKIPESYWKTEPGKKIAGAMHGEGWEVSDYLGDIISLLDEGITSAKDQKIQAELVKARSLMSEAKETYWQAAALLKDSCF